MKNKLKGFCLKFGFLFTVCCVLSSVVWGQDSSALEITTFQADVTPPLGAPLCWGNVQPAKKIVDALSARGIVFKTGSKPIVLCAIDWVLINNESHDLWVNTLAQAAGTIPERVSVHTLHQHNAPGVDQTTNEILSQIGMAGMMFDRESTSAALKRTTVALKKSLLNFQKVTHVGFGQAKVEKVASNRRILGANGKVAIVRLSSTRNPAAIKAPEGVIDPYVKLVSFWNEETPLVSITHYATHPQSHYGKGGVSSDFVGLARAQREQELPNVKHIHFNGAGGNIAAGKYNNGSPEVRPVLTKRLAKGMKQAWDSVKREPISAKHVTWDYRKVSLPVRSRLKSEQLTEKMKDKSLKKRVRVFAARDLAFLLRMESGHRISIGCLKLNNARLLYMPGELFVEYQLAANEMLPNQFVAMSAYGDSGPGYIGTEISYSQGGYETGYVSRTAPAVERVLMSTLKSLLSK